LSRGAAKENLFGKRDSIVTMASADFPSPLSAGISPGQGLFFPFAPLGSTECRQWLLGFAFASAPDTLPHCPFVFLRSNVCYHPFAPAPCGDLAVRLRLAPQAPGENISSRQIRPLPGTLVWCNRIIFTAVALKLACGEARLVSIADQRSVTEEQRSHRPISAQPEGRQFFFAQTSLLTPYRSLTDMLVVRASPARKITCRDCKANSVTPH